MAKNNKVKAFDSDSVEQQMERAIWSIKKLRDHLAGIDIEAKTSMFIADYEDLMKCVHTKQGDWKKKFDVEITMDYIEKHKIDSISFAVHYLCWSMTDHLENLEKTMESQLKGLNVKK